MEKKGGKVFDDRIGRVEIWKVVVNVFEEEVVE